MFSLKHTLVFTVLLSVIACGPEYGTEFERQSEEIINGMVTNAHPAVGLLLEFDGNRPKYLCTGTLIGKRTVLTAAHCYHDEPGLTSVFLTGTSIRDGALYATNEYEVTRFVVHSAYRKDAKLVGGQPKANDIAVLKLKSVAKETPIAIAKSAPWPDQPINLVGYGRTGLDIRDSAVKRETATNINSVTDQGIHILGASNICSGDSGGPAFSDNVQVGIFSTGNCGDGGRTPTGNAIRTDVFASWILRKAASWNDTIKTVTQANPLAAVETYFGGSIPDGIELLSIVDSDPIEVRLEDYRQGYQWHDWSFRVDNGHLVSEERRTFWGTGSSTQIQRMKRNYQWNGRENLMVLWEQNKEWPMSNGQTKPRLRKKKVWTVNRSGQRVLTYQMEKAYDRKGRKTKDVLKTWSADGRRLR